MVLHNNALPVEVLRALVEASAAINRSLELELTLRVIAEHAAEVMHAEACTVLLLDRQRHKLLFKAATGQQGSKVHDHEFDADAGIAGRVIRTGNPVLVSDIAVEGSFCPGLDAQAEFTPRCLMAAPLVRNQEVIGVIEVLNRREGANFTVEDIPLLQVFARLAAAGTANALAYEQLKIANRGLLASQTVGVSIVGQSQALHDTLELCARVASSPTTVLMLGETGTGKELFSRHIHAHSPRCEKPFITIRCAAVPEALLERTLFGQEEACLIETKPVKLGQLELSEGGTVFLDEIADLPPSTQAKLLRFLRERTFARVGGTHLVACDVRIIAATKCDPAKAVEDGRLREDLYCHLRSFPIKIPPLRDRRDDIPLLVAHFLRTLSQPLGFPCPAVSDEAMTLLMQYSWPGNIRELRNVIERAVLLFNGKVIDAAQLPYQISGDAAERSKPPAETTLPGYERALIVKTLKDHAWNQTRAAAALGISRDNLRYRIKKHQIVKSS